MKISVITVCRNASATIEETINSVAVQVHPDVEHIVVDGCSTDDTLAIVARHGETISRLLSEPDDGVYDAMNKGIRLATGEVIGFLNADDTFADERVLADIARNMTDPSVDACYGDLVYVGREEGRQRILRYWKSCDYRPGLCSTGWMPAHPTFYVRRRIYDELGGFDLSLRLQSDFEMAVRLLDRHGIRTRYIPRVLVRMKVGGMSNNSIVNIAKGNWEAYRACRKNGLRVTPLFILRKLFSRIPQLFQRSSVP
jgi:glycosyltransferase involved in cell wall biosynthesis